LHLLGLAKVALLIETFIHNVSNDEVHRDEALA